MASRLKSFMPSDLADKEKLRKTDKNFCIDLLPWNKRNSHPWWFNTGYLKKISTKPYFKALYW
jgi:hypothetical protein